MEKRIIMPINMAKPVGPYSPGVLINGILYGSGQIALIPETNELELSSIVKEANRVLQNIGLVLKEAGMDYDNIVKTTILLSDINLFSEVNDVYSTFFKNHYPARETYAVKTLPKNVNIEISFIAHK